MDIVSFLFLFEWVCQTFLSFVQKLVQTINYLLCFYIICIVQFQTCTNNHVAHRWCSQPILNRRVHSGDVLFSAALLASGNNFQKLSLFAKFFKLLILSVSSFTKIQITYVIPTIEEIWTRHQNEILENFRGSDVVLLGEYKAI